MSLSKIHNWVFQEENEMGDPAGDAYSKAISNKGKPKEHALVREAGQNSKDAMDSGASRPVKLVIRREVLGPARSESFAEISRIGVDFEPRLEGLRLTSADTINDLKNGQSGINLLYIEDYNTIGLGGPLNRTTPSAHFRKLALSFGVGDKLVAGASGGSYGFGKSVYSGSSDCKTVFFYSSFDPTEETDGAHARLMGCAYLKGHQFQGRDYTGRAWWGVPREDGKAVKPYVDDQAHELAEKLGFKRRAPGEKGASVLIVGCGKLDMSEIRKAFELYWWPSIIDQTFDIELIDDDTLLDPPRPKLNESIRPFVKAYELYLGIQQQEHKVAAKKEVKASADTVAGTWAAVHVDRDTYTGDEEWLDSVALMRQPRMVVNYEKVGREYLPGFASVFVATDDIDHIFKKSEPQEHDIWSVHADELNEYERNIVSKSMNRLKADVREFQRNLKPPAPPGGIRLPELQRMLGSIFKAKGQQKEPPKRPADPVHVHIQPVRNDSEDGARLYAKVKIRLKDDFVGSELPAKVVIRIPVLANDTQTADDDPIRFKARVGAGEYGESVEKLEWSAVLLKDETLEMEIESESFPLYQVVRLEVYCGQGEVANV